MHDRIGERNKAMNERNLSPTVCPYCGVGCGFYLHVTDAGAAGIEYMTDHPICNGRLCAKGNAALEVLTHPDRLHRPMVKAKKGFEPISWERALDMVAERLGSVARSSSPDSLGFLASAKCTNEENYLFQKLVRILGTNNVDHCARL